MRSSSWVCRDARSRPEQDRKLSEGGCTKRLRARPNQWHVSCVRGSIAPGHWGGMEIAVAMGTHVRLKRRVVCGISFGLVLLAGCGDSAYSPSGTSGVARDRVTRGPVAPRRFATVPQTAVDTATATVAPWAAIAFPADVSLDARLLVITADGTDPAFTAIVEGLQYLGTPFDV